VNHQIHTYPSYASSGPCPLGEDNYKRRLIPQKIHVLINPTCALGG
jgi:hypothetical protein